MAARFERDGDLIHGTWEAILERQRFPVDDFDELKKFWSAARRASSPAIIMDPNAH